ncbi:t-SNARE [Flagelloscypha sp. PMI_526]|nr:t-SNARE [Flagelloscypha sp. PMI_526]
MSFQDAEQGRSQPNPPDGPKPSAFKSLQSSLGLQVFKLNSNIQQIHKLVDQLGTSRDNASLRKTLHDLTESTRDMAKRAGEDLKQACFRLFEKTAAFQDCSEAERQRTMVQDVKLAVDQTSNQPYADEPPCFAAATPNTAPSISLVPSGTSLSNEPQLTDCILPEREEAIREVEVGIHDVSGIFDMLAGLVHEQADTVNNIETYISSVEIDTDAADREVTRSYEYQRRAGRRTACLMIIFAFVVAICLLAVLS